MRVQYLVSVYGGQANTSTLSDLIGKSFETLDAEYREFLKTASPAIDRTSE